MTKIVPTKTMTEKPTVESSPSYPPSKPQEPVIVTSPLPNPASYQPPIVQKKLQKHAVVAGRALKIQVCLIDLTYLGIYITPINSG